MPGSELYRLLVALAAVLLTGRLFGALLARWHQPPVIGSVVAGIALGPSVLGALSTPAHHFIFHPSVGPLLGAVADLGVVLYMFIVGLELNVDHVRGRLSSVAGICLGSNLVPFVIGVALAWYLHPYFSTSDVPLTPFALFLGTALSVTAFPVLARILAELHLTRTPLGALALTCAAVGDVSAWCLLAVVVGLVQARADAMVGVVVLTGLFVAAMVVVARPLLARAFRSARQDEPSLNQKTLAMGGLLISALITDAIGIHALFGAFLFGAMLSRETRLASTLIRDFDGVVTLLLLPAFFAITGMRTEIGTLSTSSSWMALGLIVLAASVGKIGGALIGARLGGLPWRDASAIGVLMNTRGLMELVVLNVGLSLGIIAPRMFTMMVLMALLTTVATTPIVKRLLGR